MAFASNTLDFVRGFFKEQDYKRPPFVPVVGYGGMTTTSPYFSYGLPSGTMSGLTDYLRIDAELVSRFIDYEDQDDSPLISCVTGETLVRTLDHGNIPIKELAEKYRNGEKFKIVAFDNKSLSFVIADAHHPRKTKTDKIIEIGFDDGTVLRCTADHKILTYKNEWKEAATLSVGESVMPLTTYLSSKGYLEVTQPFGKINNFRKSEPLYRLVARAKFGSYPRGRNGFQVHHIDGNKLNDGWDNLELLTREEHCRKHYPAGMEACRNLEWTPERRMKHAVRLRGNSYRRGVKWTAAAREKLLSSRSKPRRHKDKNIEQILSVVRSKPFIADAAKELGMSWSTVCRWLSKHGYDYTKEAGKSFFNHKVLYIKECGTADVYDLTTDVYHNFIANGIVVHNSSLDIYSDEATQVDSQTGFSINIKCENEAIRQSLHDLFHKRLRIEESIWQHVRLLCKYGNNEAEIVAKDQVGVIALNALPAPTVRRIELPKQIGMGMSYSESADTLGFLYDPTGLFKITTQEFIQDLNKRSGSSDGMKETSQEGRQTGCVTFEGWEIMHMRLLGKNPNSIYGFGIGEPARWIFKRLMLLEDSIILHRLCLRGDTNVWTTSGYKKIKDLNEGDEVYSYGKDLKLKKTKVVYKKHNGVDKIYRIRSKHREIYANATHPVLVEIEHHQGSGKPILRGMEYVEVKNLIPGKHKFVTPMVGDEHAEIVELKLPEVPKKSRIKSGHFILNRPKYLFKIGIDCGVEYGRLKQFIRGEKWLPEKTAKLVTSSLGLDGDCLETVEDWGNLRQVRIPKNPTVEFARLFGFMIGDGFIAQKRHKNGYLAKNSVGIALGDSEEFNSKYIQLFRDFFGDGYLSYKNGRKNSYSVNSKLLYEFFELNGYIRGAENKRVPEWIYRSNQEIKRAFIDGLVDADGHRKESRSQGIRDVELSQSISLEMCNEALLVDVRELCMQLGFSVGQKIIKRERPGGHLIEDRLMPATTSYTLHFSLKEYNQEREIISIDQVEDDDIWDIGVEADEHNFIANGVVVHNTRAPSRYAFYVDVSQIPPNETTAYLNKVKQSIKKQKFVNPNGNKMDQKYNVLSSDDDFFLPTREGRESTRVESLAGPIYDHIEDIRFFENKLFAALKVPKPFLTYEETTAKTHLSAEDARFARTIIRIQREVRNGLRKVARVHLAAIGINPDSIDFDISMTIPSAIFELAQLEIRSAELDLAEKFSAWADRDWIMHNILNFSDQQITEMQKKKKQDEMAGEEAPKGSASGDLDKALSKRGQQVLPSKTPENASRVYRKGILVNSQRRKNTEYLKERIEEQRTKDPVFDQRWSEITGLMDDLKDALGK